MIKEKYITNIKETCIKYFDSNIGAIRLKNDTKTSLRIYKDNFIGIAGKIGNYTEADLENEAISSLQQEIPYPYELSKDKKEYIDKRQDIISNEDLVNEVASISSIIEKDNPDFIFSNNIKLTESNISMFNDKNLDLNYRDKVLEFNILFKLKNSKNLVDGDTLFYGRNFNKKSFVDEVNMLLDSFNNKVDIPKGKKLPVIFLGNVPIYKIIEDLNGQIFGKGSSLFSGNLGKKIFNDNFTLCQTFNPHDVLNTPFFDSEGVVNDNYIYNLIQNGVLKSPYTDKKTASMFNLPLTGNASALYDEIPKIKIPLNDPLNSYKIKESDKTIKEILNGEKAIFAYITEGAECNSKGDFSTPVQLAFLFDGEKILGRLPQLQISSNIFDMFGTDFRGVSKDSFLKSFSSNALVVDAYVNRI